MAYRRRRGTKRSKAARVARVVYRAIAGTRRRRRR